MPPVRTDEDERVIIDGSHPSVSVEIVETDSQTEVTVTITPVPPTLESYFFGNRGTSVTYRGPLHNADRGQAEVWYRCAHLNTDGGLSLLTLSGSRSTTADERSGKRPPRDVRLEPGQPAAFA